MVMILQFQRACNASRNVSHVKAMSNKGVWRTDMVRSVWALDTVVVKHSMALKHEAWLFCETACSLIAVEAVKTPGHEELERTEPTCHLEVETSKSSTEYASFPKMPNLQC